MTYNFRDWRDVAALPFTLVAGAAKLALLDCNDRPRLIMRWHKSSDGRLEGQWERER